MAHVPAWITAGRRVGAGLLALAAIVLLGGALSSVAASPAAASPAPLATTGPASVPPVDANPRTDAERFAENRLFDAHNLARRDPGQYGHSQVDPTDRLDWADDVAEVARAWSDQMASERDMYHNPHFGDQVCCWLRVGENIAYFFTTSYVGLEAVKHNSDGMMQAWMDSDGHRRNITNRDYDQVGIGVTIDESGGLWATAVFRGGNADAPAPQPDPPPVEDPTDGPDEGPVGPPPAVEVDDYCGPAPAASRFVDVDRHIGAIDCLATAGVTQGAGDDRYGPGEPVTRAQMARFIARTVEAVGGELPEPATGWFTDVPADLGAAERIEQVAAAGIVSGRPDGTYQPASPVTRGQMAHFLVEAYRLVTDGELDPPHGDWFDDVAADATFSTQINQAADLGLATGDGNGRYGPDDVVRRDHMALFLTRLLAILDQP